VVGARCLLLGPIAVRGPADGAERLLTGQAARFLAALGTAHPNPVAVSTLIEVVWDGQPTPTAAGGLRVVANKVRSALRAGEQGDGSDQPDPVVHAADSYRLALAPDEVDVVRFARLLDCARSRLRTGDPAQAGICAQDALALWRGEAFGDLGASGWLQSEAARLQLLRFEAEDLAVEALLAEGRAEQAAARADDLVRAQPLHEHRWARLMLALYRCGRQAEALRAYQRAVECLGEEVGVEPGPDLRAMEQAVLMQDPQLEEGAPIGGAGGIDVSRFVHALRATTAGRLPAPATSFVGRREEVDELASLLRRHRLVTVLGPGGVGKTRLAVEVASGADAREVVFVALATRAAGSIAEALAEELRVQRRADEDLVTTLVEQLRQSTALIVLDNCEHLVEASGEVAQALVDGCPGVTVLATSRIALGCEAEARFPLEPLPLADARQLLIDRAAAAGADLAAEDAEHDEVVDRLLGRLDRLPLAIELAAGQLDAMSSLELDALVASSLITVRSGGRTEERHRDMAAAVGWSYEMLPGPTAELFDCLGVMTGPFRAEDAAAVADLAPADAAALLRDLARVSLLEVEPSGTTSRFTLLEAMRQYARGRLGDHLPDVADRHLQHFRNVASLGSVALRGPEELTAVDQLETVLDQMRSAFRRALDTADVDAGAAMAVDLWDFGLMRLHYDTFDWAEAMSEVPAADEHPLYPQLLGTAGLGAWARGDPTRARALGEAAFPAAERLGAPDPIQAHHALMNVAGYEGDGRTSAHHLGVVLRWSLEEDDPYWITSAHVIATVGAALAGVPEIAAASAAAARQVAERSANPSTQGWAAYASGLAGLDAAPEAAIPELERGAALARSVRNGWVLGMNLSGLVTALRRVDRHEEALLVLHELLVLWDRGDNRAQLGHAMVEAALLLAHRGAGEPAGAALRVADTIPLAFPPLPSDRDRVVRLRGSLAGAMGHPAPASEGVAAVISTVGEVVG
jgi:predicted ATPase/DNA-binding SARP family transcriptional activator